MTSVLRMKASKVKNLLGPSFMFHLDSDEIWTFRLASIHFTFSSLAALTFAAVTNIVFICGKIVFQLTVVWCSSKLQLGK